VPQIDKVLMCRDCGSSFTFTVGEQAFYASRGLTNEPGRCPSCRSARGRTPRQMLPAVYANCDQMTEVPFLPHSGRPVYCSDCFTSMRQTAH
jgi:CxxC-x17-CxxC domain-containing protein